MVDITIYCWNLYCPLERTLTGITSSVLIALCTVVRSPSSFTDYFFFFNINFNFFCSVCCCCFFLFRYFCSFLPWSNCNITNFDQEKLEVFTISVFRNLVQRVSQRLYFSHLLHTARKSSCFPTSQANLTHPICDTLWARVRIFVNRQFISNSLLCCV